MSVPEYIKAPLAIYQIRKARKRKHQQKRSIFEERRDSYWYEKGGIVRFCYEVIGIKLHDYQARILVALQEKKRVAIKSLRGVGKTTIASLFALWAVSCCPTDIKVICTASVWEQLTKYLFPEIRKWAFKANWDYIGIEMRDGKELLAREIQLDNGQKHVFMTSPSVPERIEGAHAETVVYIFDEAKIIPNEIFDAIEGAFSTANTNAFIGVFSTPGASVGRFYDIFNRRNIFKHWHTDSITLDEALSAGMIDRVHMETHKLLWGENSPLFKNHFLGEFADSAEFGLIQYSWIQNANTIWVKYHEKLQDILNKKYSIIYGVDPADTGFDRTAITKLHEEIAFFEWLKYYNEEVLETVPRLIKLGVNKERDRIAIDGLGVGAGAYQMLRNQRYKTTNVKFSGRAVDKTGKYPITDTTGVNTFKNIRIAAYWALREALNPASAAYVEMALPPDEDLTQDLLIHEYQESLGVLRMKDTKEKIKESLRRSPDGGDAVAIAWWLSSRRSRARRSRVYRID